LLFSYGCRRGLEDARSRGFTQVEETFVGEGSMLAQNFLSGRNKGDSRKSSEGRKRPSRKRQRRKVLLSYPNYLVGTGPIGTHRSVGDWRIALSKAGRGKLRQRKSERGGEGCLGGGCHGRARRSFVKKSGATAFH